MANPKHVEILKQGVELWNRWREENPTKIPKLSKADLSVIKFPKADLSGADLRGADLSGANLKGSDLSGAALSRANLITANASKANFSEANLNKADIYEADLRWADFNGADLSKASLIRTNLIGAKLRGSNLSGAKLDKAYLSKADFSKANIFKASLRGAYLSEANLRGAVLGGADLKGAYLRNADIGEADLSGADLSGAYLGGCNFKNAILGISTFVDVDLSDALDLNLAKHVAPSAIGIDTIYSSHGKIPESFMRECGVPDDFIKLIPSLTSQPFQFYSCFISYSSQDDDFAHRLHADLQSNKVRVWFAPEDMKIGDKILERLDHSIRIHDKLLLVLSEQSINSDWVEDEVTTAFEEERRRKKTVLFPIMLDDAVMDTNKAWAAKVRQRHIGDFTDWKNHDSYKKAFDRLLRDLKASEE